MDEKVKQDVMSAAELKEKLFAQILRSDAQLDIDVLNLVEAHLATDSPHSKAGNKLAEQLIELAMQRAEENRK